MLKRILLGLICGWGLTALFLISVSLVAPPPGEGRDADLVRQAHRPAVPIQLDPPEPAVAEAAPETAPDAASDPDAAPAREVAAAVPAPQAVPDGVSPTEGVPVPAGSQFNQPRQDPDVTVAQSEGVSRPVPSVVATPEVPGAPEAPRANTRPVAQPQAVQIVTSANAPAEGMAPVLPSLTEGATPQTFAEARIDEVEVAAPPAEVVETAPATPEPATADNAADAPATQAPSAATEVAVLQEPPDVGVQTAPELADAPRIDIAADEAPSGITEVAVLPVPDAVTPPAIEDAPETDGPALARVVPAEPENVAPEVTSDAPGETPTETTEAPADTAPEAEEEAATLETVIVTVPPETETDETPAAPEAAEPDVVEDAPADAAIPETAGAEPIPETATETAPETGVRILRTDRPLAQAGLQGNRDDAAAAPEAETVPDAASTESGTLPRRLTLDSQRESEAEVVEETPAPVEEIGGPALIAHAAAFDNPENRPLLAIVLVTQDDAPADLAFDFPVTIALDGAGADAGDAAATLRAAGQEVMLQADALAMDGSPQDVEIALAGARNVVPQAVGVLDRAEGGFSTNRDALAGLLPALADAGMGFLSYPTGLNSGLSTARREGVAAAPVLRRIDAVGEGLNGMDRALTRAAFEAARDGAAVVVVLAEPEIVTALKKWQVGGNADAVALAPISAVLQAGQN